MKLDALGVAKTLRLSPSLSFSMAENFVTCDVSSTDDANRVVLSDIAGIKGSDYINASFINVSPEAIIQQSKIILAATCSHRGTRKRRPTLLHKVSK